MLEAVLSTLSIMGYLGIVLGVLVLINTICGIIKNTSNGEPFSWKILGKGLLKAFVFYACSTMLGIAFTMIPEVNKMIQDVAGVQLFAQDTLNTLSSVAVFAVVAAAVISQGKSALEGVTELLQVKVSGEKITWEVDDSEEGNQLPPKEVEYKEIK
jgi:hypothetical protein